MTYENQAESKIIFTPRKHLVIYWSHNVMISYFDFRTTIKRTRIESAKSGNVVVTFGNYAARPSEKSHQNVTIKLAELGDGTQWINEKTKYMTVSMQEEGQMAAERIFNIGKEISKKIVLDEKKISIAEMTGDDQLVLSHCDDQSQESVRCLGKIFCGGRTDQLDQKSCIFIGFDENKSRIVQLDLSRLKPSVQVFPGEICIIGGKNPRGKVFYVTELYSERILENCLPPSDERLTAPLNLVVASAPFTADDNLLFDYLEKLMMNCQNNKPDVLILTGAFLPIKSQLIFDIAMELDEHFKKMLSGISERVGNDTKVIIVASGEDINSSACFPTRPYKLKQLVRPFPNLFMAPDPCIVDINGIQIAITSTDIVQHLSDSEYTV